MTTIRCPDKRFRTERYARRFAWGLHADPEQRPVPVQCERCGAWHLEAPEQEGTTR